MSSNSISTRITEIGFDVQKLFQKISKLESSNENLSQLLNNEIIQRQNLEKHTLTTNEAFSGQLNALKGSFDHFGDVINNNMEKLKSDILEDVHKKNSDFISLIESNIKSDSKSPFTLNKNNEYDEKFKRIEDMINNEFNQYRSELNTNIINSEFNSKKIDEIISKFSLDLTEIQKQIQNLNNENEQLKTFRIQTISEIKKIKENNFQKDNSYEQFIQKMDNVILELGAKMKNYDDIFRNHTNNFDLIKNDIYNQFKEMNNSIKKNNNEFTENYNKKYDNLNKEIKHFENHILSEHDKFIQFIQNHFDEQNNSLKKLFDYNTEDIDILKARTENLENSIKKLRTDVFKGINETEEFLEKKYESIFRIINKVS